MANTPSAFSLPINLDLRPIPSVLEAATAVAGVRPRKFGGIHEGIETCNTGAVCGHAVDHGRAGERHRVCHSRAERWTARPGICRPKRLDGRSERNLLQSR